MDELSLTEAAQQWANDILVWVGFGTLVGLLAKAIMPGRDRGGALATTLMGIGGSIMGCSLLMFATGGQRVTPISPLGFIVATAGAFILLAFSRVFGGTQRRIINQSVPRPHGRRRSGADVQTVIYEE